MAPRTDRDFDLLGYGVAAVDELIEVDAMPELDVKVDIRSHRTRCGGICINALATATKLGCRCHFAGPLGAGPLSEIVRSGMDDAGISYPGEIAHPDAGPSHAFILVDRSTGDRTIFMDKSRVRDLDAAALPDALLARTRALYVDAWHLDAGLHAVRRAAGLGVTVIADFEEHDPEQVRRLLPFVDHLIVPLGYGRRLTGAGEPVDVLLALATEPRHCTAVTCGEDGALFVTGDAPRDVCRQPAFEVDVVDTTGCGDAFHGAYITAVLNGRPADEAIRFAAAAAALCARAVGAQTGLPSRDEVERLVSDGVELPA